MIKFFQNTFDYLLVTIFVQLFNLYQIQPQMLNRNTLNNYCNHNTLRTFSLFLLLAFFGKVSLYGQDIIVRIFDDRDGSGVFNAGDVFITGFTPELWSGGSNTLIPFVEGPVGRYNFSGVPPGTYTIMIETINGAFTIMPNQSYSSGETLGVNFSGPPETIDIGFYRGAEIGDYAWEDMDGDGIQELGEPPVSGLLVEIYDDDGILAGSDITDAAGAYLITGIVPGINFHLQFYVPAGFDRFTKFNAFGFPGLTVDSDANPDLLAADYGQSDRFDLSSGQTNVTGDVGVWKFGKMSGVSWNDCNGNGIKDDGNVMPTGDYSIFDRTTGQLIATNTDNNGTYNFDELPPGSYYILFNIIPDPPPPGFSLVTPNQGGPTMDSNPTQDSGIYFFNIRSGDVLTNVDGGYTETFTLPGNVFEDIALDGVIDSGDDGIGAAAVELLYGCPGGAVIKSVVTTSDGQYSFTNVPSGSYTIKVVLSGDLLTLTPSTPLEYCVQIGCGQPDPEEYIFGFGDLCGIPSAPGEVELAICPAEVPYDYEGININDDLFGDEFTLPNITTSLGCDSIVRINARILRMDGEIKLLSCVNSTYTLAFDMDDIIQSTNDYDQIEYSWFNNNMLIGSATTLVTTRTGLFTLRITVNKFGTDCISNFDFNINPLDLKSPKPLLNGTDKVCLDNKNDIIFIPNPISGTTYEWTYPDTFKNVTLSVLKDSIFINWNIDTTANVCVRANNGCGWSDFNCISVKPNITPKPNIFAKDSICLNNSTLLYTNSADTIFFWNITNDTLYTGKQTKKHSLDIVWDTDGYKYISLVAVRDGCASLPTLDSLLVFSPSIPPILNCSSTNSSVTFTWTDPSDVKNYIFNPSGGFSGTHSLGSEYTITGLPSGQSVSLDIEVISSNPCGNYTIAQNTCTTQDCIPPVVMLDASETILCLGPNSGLVTLSASTLPITAGVGLFSGPGVDDAKAVFDPNIAGVGTHTISYNFTATADNCMANSSIVIQIKATPIADFNVSNNIICIDDVTNVNYSGNPANASVTWIIPNEGMASPSSISPFDIRWSAIGDFIIKAVASTNGCVSDTISKSVKIEPALSTPVINCQNIGQNDITFAWDAISTAGYEVLIDDISRGNITTTQYTESGLAIDTDVKITVRALSNNSCPGTESSAICSTSDCLPLVFIFPNDTIQACQNTTPSIVNLSATIGGNVNPSGLVWTSSCISCLNSVAGTFDMSLANIGRHTIYTSYTSGTCVYTDSIIVIIKLKPIANIQLATDTICVTDVLPVLMSGTFAPGILNSWLDGSIYIQNISGNTVFFKWPTPGNYNISLVSVLDGCMSDEISRSVVVEPAIEIPSISCQNVSQNSLTFGWNNVTSGGYEILINDVSRGTISTTQFTESGLTVDTDVKITVRAISNNNCPGTEASTTCRTSDCPQLTFTFPLDTIDACQNAAPSIINLSATIGGNVNPTGLTWTSNCISCLNSFNGTFDLSQANVGRHTIYATYTNGSCMYNDSIIVFIKLKPTLNIQITEDTICITDILPVTISGTSVPGMMYAWLNGASYIQSTTGNTVFFKWQTPGIYDIRLVSRLDGCMSEEVAQTITVEPELVIPVINCVESLDSITINWTQDNCADQYVVLVNSQTVSTQSTNSFIIKNLSVGQSVDIQIQSISKCACPGVVSVIKTCKTQDCPTVSLSFPQDTLTFCLSDNPQNQILSATVTGGNTSGILQWNGIGVSNNNVFSPIVAGVGVHQITAEYMLGSCNYTKVLVAVVNNSIAPALTANDTICVTETLRLNISVFNPNATLDFTDGKNNLIETLPGNAFNFKWNTSGTYKISAFTMNKGCKSELTSKSVVVEPELPPLALKCSSSATSVTIDWTDQDCAKEYIVTANSMLNPAQIDNTFTLQNLLPGQSVNFIVQGISKCACPDRMENITCRVPDCPNVNILISGPVTANIGADVTLSLQNNNWTGLNLDSIVWTSNNKTLCTGNCQQISFKVPETETNYEVIVYFNSVCISTKTHTIMPTRVTNITVPNIINVNGQSNNGGFKVFTDDESLLVTNMSIYDRWGNLLFTAKNFYPAQSDISWNGKWGNTDVVPGVYVYFIECSSELSGNRILNGDVTIIR